MKAWIVGIVCLAVASTGTAQDSLTAAKDLYASAAYDGASDEALADLRVLVDGFLDLTRAAENQRPVDPAQSARAADSPGAATASKIEPTKTLYDVTAAGVTAPIVIRQDVPPVPPGLGN